MKGLHLTREQMPLIEIGVMHAGILHPYGEVVCARCGYECEWEECYAGCDDGYFDGYEEDPLLYDPGELVPCSECNGRGGSYWCYNQECSTHQILHIRKVKTCVA